MATFGGGVLYLRTAAHAGRVAWRAEDGPVAQGSLVQAGGALFGTDGAGLTKLDMREGDITWTLGDSFSTPAGAGDTIYVGGQNQVAAYALSGGVGLEETRMGARRWSYRWHLLKNQEYLVDYGDPKMIVNNGTQYIVVPYSTPTFHLTPLPHSIPEWGGVAVIDPSGSIEMLSPEEAAQNPILDSQQLYPEDLARRKVASTKYRNGILNTYTSHEDEIEIAPVPGDGNDQPFFVLSEEGPQYMVAVEPYGEAQGLREVWTIDGQTGAFEVYRPNESLFGPQKAADLVRQSAPQTDWNRFSPAEPILTVIDDREYWQVRIVREDNSGIAYVAFVDAQTSDVEEFEETEAIKQFLTGETPVEPPDQPGDGEAEETPTVIVQRVDENGTVIETMEIYGNESVRIETNPNGSGATTNTSTNTSTERVRAPL